MYMSPEQIKDSKHIDKRSDLYTLGVIFYEILTSNLPYDFSSLPDLYNKILFSPPIPPRKWNSTIENRIENIILKLLSKEPYQRYSNINQLLGEFLAEHQFTPVKQFDLDPKFLLRLYNEKTVLDEFTAGSDFKMFVEFPANHQGQQKGLLKLVEDKQFVTLIDPSTMRLAYPAQADVKGLQSLPYAPPKFQVITPEYLASRDAQLKYVKDVIDEQYKLKCNLFISPYHYIHNTNVPATMRRNPVNEWFDLDIKLLKESIDYKASVFEYRNIPLYAGICLNGDSLLDKAHTSELLNLFSSFDCDGFLIYVDCIDNNTSAPTLYHYIKTLMELQKSTGRPVIAGRLNSIGLGLLCSGISCFSSGAARFDSFYEGLYKEETETYNLYERYYLPELLSTVSIDRRTPIKLDAIREKLGSCKCFYCDGKSYIDVIQPKYAKLHFLDTRYTEIEEIKRIPVNDRLSHFISRIDKAILNYQKLGELFKPNDYSHLYIWKEVFEEIKKETKDY
ncbi:MAG: hypothetical protein EOO43_11615 [Flavobacterium sp.]|nr:MAG: hypothetical protein EOO43_11615 [Flavobacterium sp.]